jgi:hypothetical protein
MPNRDPDRHLPDPGAEAPDTCDRHGLELDRYGGCYDCEQERDDDARRIGEAMGIVDREE